MFSLCLLIFFWSKLECNKLGLCFYDNIYDFSSIVWTTKFYIWNRKTWKFVENSLTKLILLCQLENQNFYWNFFNHWKTIRDLTKSLCKSSFIFVCWTFFVIFLIFLQVDELESEWKFLFFSLILCALVVWNVEWKSWFNYIWVYEKKSTNISVKNLI